MKKNNLSCDVLKKKTSINHFLLIMRTAIILLFTCVFISVAETGYTQNAKVSLSRNNTSLKEILNEIENQTDYLFIYNNEVNTSKIVSVDSQNKTVREVLNHVLKDLNIDFLMEGNHIILSYIEKAKKEVESNSEIVEQQDKKRSIRGVVTDVYGEPLAGVTVFVKGTSTGIATGLDGEFSLEVEDNPQRVISFSFIGMETIEMPLGNRTVFNVEMEELTQMIDEVMVVAYGTVKKESFTGSAAVIRGDQVMKEASPLSAERALQGYVAGVRVTQADGQPGAKATVQIRGVGSINGNLEPLYVIDGVPVVSGDMATTLSSNVMSSINPDDIESMTVLKDAAATSLYGSRAANGVIIITTKRGKSGKTEFNVDYEYGWTDTAMPHELYGLYMSGKEYTEYSIEGLKNRYLYDRKALPGQENYNINNSAMYDDALDYAYLNLNRAAKVIHPDDPMDGSFDYANADRGRYLSDARNTDWANSLFSTGREHKANVSARGGGEKMKFFTSLGYMDQEGLIPTSSFKRITGKIGIDNTINKYLKFSIDETISKSDQSGTSSGNYYSNPIWGVKNSNPTAPIYMPDGTFNTYPGFNTKIANFKKNIPIQYREVSNFRSMTNFALTATFTDYLTFRSINGIDYIHITEHDVAGIDSHDGRNEGGRLTEFLTRIYDLTSSNTLNFNKNFSDHSLSALVGYEVQKNKRKNFYVRGVGFISDNFFYLSNASNATTLRGTDNEDNLISYLTKVDYDYRDKYYLSASYRRDASSRLAKDERWGDFYAFSGAWNLSRESFMEDVNWLDNLRAKLSYGTTGNLPTGYYESQSLFSLSNNYNGRPVFYLKNIGNPELTWEHSYTWNTGIDFSLFNFRLSGSLEYYNKITDNLLNHAPVSSNTGFSSTLVNEGKLRNTGFELTLSSRNIVSKNFNWSTDLNITTMKAKVEELADDVISTTRIFREGEPLFSLYLREWAGVDQETGEPMWYKNTYEADGKTPIKDGSTTTKVAEANRVVVGKAYPDVYGGITNRFSYKGVELSFLLTYTLGGQTYHNLDRLSVDGKYIGTYNPVKSAADDVWRQPGDNASSPLIIYDNPYQPQEYSSRFVKSTDHLRVKNITLGYNLPKKLTSKLGMTNMKVFFNANNIFTFYKYDSIDPEVSYYGYTTGGSTYPAIKSLKVGFNVKF